MPFVNKSGGDGEELSDDSATPLEFDFDPNDPDVVKVHYNLAGWTFDQRAELAETLAEHGVPHLWEGEELVVPELIEGRVDALFDELERELGPFPVPLGADDESTEFGLDEWPFGDVETLKEALVEAEIPHRWEGRTLFVVGESEHVVDDLLDAIEAGEVASIDEDAEAPDGALHNLYVAADRLARDSTNGAARTMVLDLVPQLGRDVPPFGLAVRAWGVIVDRATALRTVFEDAGDSDAINEAADELRTVCRPYV